ncbi:UdgX family uracil-DNA binding protein [Pseudorhodoferax sp.]|uniref:UdgX family uracil-DNA binding protein n=1 Tax=Pseudorhodoferax sp. TaxID=1993553 RepID=UPI0039E2C5D3
MPAEVEAVQLAADDDLAGFRAAVRDLVARRVPPEAVHWQCAQQAGGLFDAATPASPQAPQTVPQALPAPPLRLPAAVVDLLQHAALHRDAGRFALLYRLVWRLLAEPGLRGDPLDADRLQAEGMARAVRRDMHKTKAFVRFRPLPDGSHAAWFEPAHHTLRATAPFFVRRFAQMRWAILTPERSVAWDGQALRCGPGANRADAPGPDAGERLWLTYYAHIFNPARPKPAMMRKEMPRRYWPNLPESALIAPLLHAAAERSGRMLEAGGADPQRRRPAASIALQLDRRPAPAAAGTLEALRLATEACRACPIGRHATQAVHGEGRPGAALMLVGEQPGDQEDLQGRPFVGPAGQVLQRALDALGWPRDALYLTNAVRHFKHELRGKRRLHKTPGQLEATACSQWLEQEIALVRPRAAIALGATAARALLGRPVAVTAVRGQWLRRADGLPVLVTLHPAALLRLDAPDPGALFAGWLDDLGRAAGVAWTDGGDGP